MDEKWVRSENGALLEVCKGLAESMGLSVGITRLIWVLSVLCLGFGLGVYVLLAIALPRRDRLDRAYKSRVLGVCAKLAKRSQTDVGLVRLLALILLIASFGMTVFVYLIAYMLLPEEGSPASRSNPSVPPSTT